MKNLFVLHTQYHLILALAVIEEEFKDAQNDLILFRDFNLSAEMEDSLRKQFHSVTLFTGSYNKADVRWREKLKRYPKINREMKKSIGYYDNLFYVEDSIIPEQYILKYVMAKNPNVTVSYIGDGGDAYFVNAVAATGLAKHKWTMKLRKLVFSTIGGAGKYYYAGCFGGSPYTKHLYEMYPELVRDELQGKTKHEVKEKDIQIAVKKLYSFLPEQSIAPGSVIVMLDKLEVYGDGIRFGQIIDELMQKANAEGRTVYYKCHPAEKKIYDKLASAVELDRNIPGEFIFAQAAGKDCTIVGVLTTALQAAKKMGLDVTSYLETFNPARREVIEFYKTIGIDVK